jgi:hypothetical protein
VAGRAIRGWRSSWPLERAIRRGELRVKKGTRCWYIDPADLVELGIVDWEKLGPQNDLVVAARRGLLKRLVNALAKRSELIQ